LNRVSSFFKWYEDKTAHAITFVFVTQVLQIPHFLWAGDVYLQLGVIGHIHPVLDFLLYGIDLIEIPSLIIATLLFITHIRKRYASTQNKIR
jgi:hypothetical protein